MWHPCSTWREVLRGNLPPNAQQVFFISSIIITSFLKSLTMKILQFHWVQWWYCIAKAYRILPILSLGALDDVWRQCWAPTGRTWCFLGPYMSQLGWRIPEIIAKSSTCYRQTVTANILIVVKVVAFFPVSAHICINTRHFNEEKSLK